MLVVSHEQSVTTPEVSAEVFVGYGERAVSGERRVNQVSVTVLIEMREAKVP